MHQTSLGTLLLMLTLALGCARAEDGLVVTARQFGGGLDMKNDWSTRIDGSEITVERTGKRNRPPRRLSPRELSALLHCIESNNFFELQHRYGCPECSDTPVYTLVVTSRGREKKVQIFCNLDGLPRIGAEAVDVQHFMALWRTVKKLGGLGGVRDVCL